MSSNYTIDGQLTERGFLDEATGIKMSPEITSGSLSCPVLINKSQSNPKSSTDNTDTTILNVNPQSGSTATVNNNIKQVGKAAAPQFLFSKPTMANKQITVRKVGHKNISRGRPQESSSTKEGTINETKGDSEDSDNSDVSEEEDEDEEDEDDEEEEGIASNGTGDGSGEHRCKVCDLVLPSAFRLQEHMHLHSGARPYRCAECGKQFCHLSNYRVHLRSHAQATATRCRVCGACFETAESLQAHLEHSHLEEEFYQCDRCKRIFTCLEECRRHVELCQCSLALHPCPQCDRQFRRRKSLLRHLQVHSRKQSYVCTECGEAFPKKNALLRHSFSHLGLLPYTCIRCQRHFRLASLYRKHTCDPEQIQCVACLGFFHSHADFQKHKEETGCWGHQGTRGDELRCMECGQTFESAEELKKHAGAHQRVLTCAECGKGFRSALLLMSHMGGHAGSRPCLCQRCGVGFPHQQSYKSHQKDCGRSLTDPGAVKKQKKDLLSKADRARKTAIRMDKPAESSDGVWRLTLDKKLPPGTTLVVFLPAETDSYAPLGAMLTKAIPAEAAITAAEPFGGTSFSMEEASEDKKIQNKSTKPETPQPLLLVDNSQCPAASCTSGTAVERGLPQVSSPVKVKFGSSDRIPCSQVQCVRAGGSCDEQDRVVLQNWDEARIKVEEGLDQDGEDMKPLVNVNAEALNLADGAAAELKDKKVVSPLKAFAEMDQALQLTCPRDVQSEIILSLVKAKEEENSTVGRDLDLQGSRVGETGDLLPHKCEVKSGVVDVKQEVISPGCCGLMMNLEDGEKGDSGGFHFVEVEVWDDDMEMADSGDEPHECLNCGQIVLDGNLMRHYMHHALDSELSFPDSCTLRRHSSAPATSPPPIPLQRILRPRKTS